MSTKDKTFMWLIIILVGLVVLVFTMVYLDKPEQVTVSPSKRELELKDSVRMLQGKIDSSRARQARLEQAYDSLLKVEPTIIYETREKIKFIYTEATPDQLDSIIRTRSKRKQRYH